MDRTCIAPFLSNQDTRNTTLQSVPSFFYPLCTLLHLDKLNLDKSLFRDETVSYTDGTHIRDRGGSVSCSGTLPRVTDKQGNWTPTFNHAATAAPNVRVPGS